MTRTAKWRFFAYCATTYFLAIIWCGASDSWAAASPPKPAQPAVPTSELQSIDSPRVPQTIAFYQDGSPTGTSSAYLWQTNKQFDLRNDFGQGQGNIHLGSLQLHPIASARETYDSNIFLQPHGQANMDWVTNYLLGLATKMLLVPSRGDDFTAETEYHANFISYERFDKNDRVDHAAHAAVTGNFSNGIGAHVTEDFFLTESPANNERTGPSKRFWNKTDGRINYTRNKVTVEAAYTEIMSHYMRVLHNLSYNDRMVTTNLFYNVSEKTRLLSEFNFGRIQYIKSFTNSNSYYYQARFGAEGRIAPKLVGTVKMGFRFQNYTRTTAQDFIGMTAFGNIKYEMTEKTTFNLYGESRPEESSYATNSFYTSNIIGLFAEHLLTERLSVLGGVFWAYDRYPDLTTEGTDSSKRRDTIWGGNVGLKYVLKDWWLLDADYSFKQRNSRFNNFDYNDHQITGRSTFLL